ncbi:MAG: hypothetical protein D6696_21540 [Acidobacteria bacterium]|nr:MAG: hypothetical protein D6696_21540 [Acidobacteriota bacterium]
MSNKRSPWLYVGCGCAAFAVLLVLAIAGAGYFGFRQVARGITDPAVRTERALALLGTDELPPGYHAQMTLSVPFIMDMAVLSDGPPVEAGNVEDLGGHERVFFFVKIKIEDKDKEEFERYLEGEEDSAKVLDQMQVDFRRSEILGRGRFDSGDQVVRYLVQKGEISERDGRVPGIFTLAAVDCPDDERMRVAAWLQRRPELAAEAPAVEAPQAGEASPQSLAGTVADEATLRDFMSYLSVCG